MHEVIGYGGDVDYSSDEEEEDDRSENNLNSKKLFFNLFKIIVINMRTLLLTISTILFEQNYFKMKSTY